MKIPRNPKKPPIQPGLQPDIAKKGIPQQKQVNPDLAKIADQRAKSLSSSAANLVSAAPSEFSKLGMQTLLRTTQMARQGLSAGKIMLAEMNDQKIAAKKSKLGSTAEKQQADRTQAWVNVGISVAVAVTGAGVATGATQAALVAAKGAGYVEGHRVGRWCQEALFFLVWSCPQAVLDANLCELAGIEG